MTTRIIQGDCRDVLKTLGDGSVQCVVTSPPYFGLRNYNVDGQMGLEPTPEEFVQALVGVLREARRVLSNDGTMWLNIGDSFANDGKWGGSTGGKHAKGNHGETGIGRGKKSTGLKPKDLIGIPWMTAFALRADGWYLRQDLIWSKPNPMPESVTDRCTKAHEYIFLLSKSERYYYDAEAIAEPAIKGASGSKFNEGKTASHQMGRSSEAPREDASTRNKRSVWTVPTSPYAEAHFATFPPALIEPCILAGCLKGGTVLDPFFGAGTTGLVADRLGRNCIGIELNPEYAAMAQRRIEGDAGIFAEVERKEPAI